MSTSNDTFRFLIVDDSRAIQSIIRRALESCNYPALDIRVANDAEIAIDLLESYKPDLIITDWHMPKISGLEFCQHVRQAYGSDIPIGFVTTESSSEKLEEARRNGASFIINKPFNDDEFTSVVLKLVPHNRTQTATETSSASIIDAKTCTEGLKKALGKHEFTLSACPPISLTDLTEDNLVGLYGFAGKPHPVAGIAVMDMRTVSLLWGISTKQEPAAIKAEALSKTHTEDYTVAANAFMENMSSLIKVPADKEKLGLIRSNVFNRTFQRLEIVLKTNTGRSDFKLSVPGIGEGVLAFILV